MYNIKELLKGNGVIIHCPSSEECERICKMLNKVGKDTTYVQWGSYKNQTCVRVRSIDSLIQYSPVDYWKRNNPTTPLFESSEVGEGELIPLTYN